ncbi:copper-binding protein, partial [Escherichia coli]|nr:copper-binding protein [Escherichia coli]
GWPAMTMTFRASPPTLLKGLRSGQRVAFTAKAKGMTAEVTAISPH